MHKSSHLSGVNSQIRWTVYSKSTVGAVKTYTVISIEMIRKYQMMPSNKEECKKKNIMDPELS